MSEKLLSEAIRIFKKHFHLFFLILIFFYTFLSVKTIFLDGMIPGWDNPVHYVHSYLTAFYMLPELNILGWDPFNQFGWVFNQYYNPGMSVFVSSIYYLFLGLIDLLLAYKIAFFLAYFLLAPALYMFVHALTGDRVAAIFASLLSVTTFAEEEAWYDAGLKQMYYIGMWPERLGLVFAFFSVAFLAYSFKSKSLSKTLFLTGLGSLFFSITVLTHAMMGVSAALMAFLLWVFTSLKTLREYIAKAVNQKLMSVLKTETIILAKFSSIGLLSLGMAAFWMVPLFQTLDTYHSFPAITWSVGPFIFEEIFTSIPWYLLVFYCIGAFSPVFTEKKLSYSSLAASSVILILQFMNLVSLYDGNIGLRLILAFVTSFVLLFSSNDLFTSFSLASVSLLGFLATGPWTYLVYFGPIRLDILSLIPFAKNFGYSKFNAPTRTLMLCVIALGFAKLSHKLYSLSKETRFSTIFSITTGLLAFLVINSSLNAQVQNTDLTYPWSKEKLFKLTSDYQGFKKVDELIVWARDNVPKSTYILFQDTLDFGDSEYFQTSHYIYLASLRLERPIIGGSFGTNYITNPYANSEGGYLLSFPVEKLLEDGTLLPRLMDELGIGYVAVHDARLISALNTSVDFTHEYYNGLYAVFRKIDFAKIISIEGNGTVESVDFAVNRIEATVTGVSGNGSYLMVKQVNFPGFTAIVDGKAARIETYYPRLPDVIMGWHWVQPVYNWKIPFIKVELSPGASKVVLRFNLHTMGSDVSRISWIVFLCLLASSGILPIVRKVKKWRVQKTI
ncbi:MAG: hypothetical protein QXF52_02910 [Thermoproteota archaeon]